MELNPLLYRQLVKSFGPDVKFEDLGEDLQKFLRLVDSSYNSIELERERTQRTFRIVDEDFKELLDRLQEELSEKEQGFQKMQDLMKSLDAGMEEERTTIQDMVENLKTSIDQKLLLRAGVEETLKTIQKQAAEKSEFLSFMSHEVRTPLNIITGIIQILMNNEYLPEQENLFAKLQDISDQTIELINNVLQMQKLDAAQSSSQNSEIALRTFFEKLVDEFSSFSSQNSNEISLIYRAEDEIHLNLDKFRLKQVCSNLLSNASKFTENGQITVEVIPKKMEEDRYEIEVCVEDTGVGMTDDEKQQLFKKFSQPTAEISTKFAGSGLGLYFSNKLLESMDSKLQVESEKGKGTKFYFVFDAEKYDQDAKPKSPVEDQIDYANLKGKRILVADDYLMNLRIIEGVLKKEGIKVDTVRNGQEALDALKQKDYDLLLLDMHMPVLDGMETAKAVRQKSDIPIIPLTASMAKEKEKDLHKIGINQVLYKPFKFDDLLASICFELRSNGSV